MMTTQERRSPVYIFKSEKMLTQYFSHFLSEEQIADVIRFMRNQFVERKNCSRRETAIQFIKKCECHLNGIVKAQNN